MYENQSRIADCGYRKAANTKPVARH